MTATPEHLNPGTIVQRRYRRNDLTYRVLSQTGDGIYVWLQATPETVARCEWRQTPLPFTATSTDYKPVVRFFEPGKTYSRGPEHFHCESVRRNRDDDDLVAFGRLMGKCDKWLALGSHNFKSSGWVEVVIDPEE